MQSLDSKAVFTQRLATLGLSEVAEKFEARGWTSYGQFAFCCATNPGQQASPEVFWREAESYLCDGREDSPLRTSIRRLYWESFTAFAADARDRLAGKPAEPRKELPPAEAEQRRPARQARPGSGHAVEPEHDPSCYLVNRCIEMHGPGQPQYIPWAA